jgi:hypothetical protein
MKIGRLRFLEEQKSEEERMRPLPYFLAMMWFGSADIPAICQC